MDQVDQASVLGTLDASFNIKEDASFADLVHALPNSGDPFQRWFRYREGFAPELITRAMMNLEIPCSLVLDPFCGTGSTLLAARHAGVDAIGIDVNPIVAIVARAKTHTYSMQDVRDITVAIAEIDGITDSMPTADRPGLSILDKVFRSDVLHALLTARRLIDEREQGRVKDFLLTGWLSILEGVSNTFKEGNGIKYRNRRRTQAGYVTVPWESLPGYTDNGWQLIKERLAAQYATMLIDVEPDSPNPPPEVRVGSSVTGVYSLDRESVSLCIFSPPYCNNFNYMKIFKVELWMSGLVSSYGDIREISHRALRSHVEMKIEVPQYDTLLPRELHALVDSIDRTRLWNAKIPETVLAYFIDMRELLRGVFESLEPGGECHIVVGNSAYAGVIIPTDVLLAKISEDLGFSTERVIVARHLTTSSQQRRALRDKLGFLRESIVVLKKEM